MPAPITVEGPFRVRRRLLRIRAALMVAVGLLVAVPFIGTALTAWLRG